MPFWNRGDESPRTSELAEGGPICSTDSSLASDPDDPSSRTSGFASSGLSERSGSTASTASGGGTPSRRAEAPELEGDEIEFVTLPDGTLLVDDAVREGALTPLAEALEQDLPPPYQATSRAAATVRCGPSPPIGSR